MEEKLYKIRQFIALLKIVSYQTQRRVSETFMYTLKNNDKHLCNYGCDHFLTFVYSLITYMCIPKLLIFSFVSFWTFYKWNHPLKVKKGKKRKLPWLVWLSGLSATLRTKRLLVRFPVRAHAWVAGQVPVGGAREATTHWCFSPFLSPSLPLSLKNKNKNL